MFRNSNIKKIIIPSSVTVINPGAFNGSAVEEIVIEGNKLKTIGSEAFYFCTKLRKINFPESVNYIGTEAFNSCGSSCYIYMQITEEEGSKREFKDRWFKECCTVVWKE